MKHCFAYTRVSSAIQEDGASLKEQAELIARYAERQGLQIVEWFEEIETAAKPGRPVFGRMVKLLLRGKAEGLIMYKIDRSSRNFHDWAQVNELADKGIAVHFAGENLELSSRGRRLLADIQVVFATDYIRNLKEETRKGIDGRLREGLITWGAPLGYVNNGKRGQKKTICPVKGPLVRQAFELYATGDYSLNMLCDELWRMGLRNQRGGRLTKNGLSVLLNNPFYIGLIYYRKNRALYNGVHEPLISTALFDVVKRRLHGKMAQKVKKHRFLYRRMFRCGECKHFLVPEWQKGHAYYRCHTKLCSRSSVREEAIEAAILAAYERLAEASKGREELELYAAKFVGEQEEKEREVREGWKLQLSAIEARENRLVDVYLEGALDREIFEKRKSALLLQRKDLEEKLRTETDNAQTRERLSQILELAFTAPLSHELANDEEKREQLEMLSSNRTVEGKNVVVELSFPFSLLSSDRDIQSGDRDRDNSRSLTNIPRTANSLECRLRHVVEEIYNWLAKNPRLPIKMSKPLLERQE
jgi:site-specific DNA recombinase